MAIVDVSRVRKRFLIPSVHRSTIREHALNLFRRQAVEELVVLDDVSFEVYAGETLGIMGRNGSGKSTLLKIVAGIYQPDGGVVRAHAGLTPLLELGVGWNPELDAIDNIMLLGSVMGLTLAELRRSTDEILAFAELERFANQKLQHYSSGMASRLAYAVAFRAVREILVLDEIFAVGDAGFRQRCERRYAELKAAGHTIIMVSHDPRVIETFCGRALLLEGGRIVAVGPGPEIVARYHSLLQRSQTGAPSELVAARAGGDLRGSISVP
jgi:ABC-2 type transport system ATP-binding protein